MMSTNKILFYSVTISMVIHLAALSLMSLIEWREGRHQEPVMMIDLQEMFTAQEKKPLPREAQVSKTKPPPSPASPDRKTQTSAGGNTREATVDINSREVRYRPYLKAVKEKIERAWTYPQKASSRKEEGTTVIRFSLAETGELVGTAIIRSSGFRLLDEASLQAVQTPRFAPLPENFQLSRLNVVASFEYRLIQ